MSFLRLPAAATLSLAVTVLANLVPLCGVLAWGWDLFSLILLYWLETAVIGLFAVARMARGQRAALPLIAFFVMHFGIFMTAHLFLVISLFGGSDDLLVALGRIGAMLGEGEFRVAIAALVGGHLVAFLAERRDAGEDRQAAGAAMKAAYVRVLVMHFAILLGAALVVMLNARAAAFATMVALKTGAEMLAEIRAQPKRSALAP